jgi:hypothetical protein
MTTDLETLLN